MESDRYIGAFVGKGRWSERTRGLAERPKGDGVSVRSEA